MSEDDQPIQEKPYKLVPFAAATVHRTSVPGHQALRQEALTGVITMTLIAHRPVQVASGGFEAMQTRQGDQIIAMDSRIARYDESGASQPQSVLPGSSIKGALRSLVEAISPSCVVISGGATRFAIPDALRRCSRVDQLCPACQLFGMSGAGRDNYQGQVSIEDAGLVEGGRGIVRVPLLWAPARGRGRLPGRYLSRAEKAFGRKVYYHSQLAKGPDGRLMFMTGAKLRFRLHIENLTPGKLGLLVAALGLHPDNRFLMKIGAAKPVGMGSVEAQWDSVMVYGPVAGRGRMGGGGKSLDAVALEAEARIWVQAAIQEQLLVEEALHDVYLALRQDNLQRSALEGEY
jgi:CRISPR/Cas system CSM-associated protein Csm3 (group 7 of RAMP superfamily)